MALMENRWLNIVDDIPMNGFQITNLANGINPQDAVTRAQLDAVGSGGGNITPGTAIGQMLYWDGLIWRRTDTTDLVFDPTTEYLGVNIGVPFRRLEVRDTTGYAFRISRSDNNNVDFYCSSSGNFYIYPSGDYIRPKKDLYTDFYTNTNTNTLLGIDVFGNGNLSASYNTAIGNRALFNAENGDSNVAIGYSSLYLKINGRYNTAIGTSSMRYMTGGDYNVAVGYYAGGDDSTFSNANRNVSIGYQAGRGIENNSSGNVFIGYQVGYNEHGSNKLYIDNSNTTSPLLYGEFDTEFLRINGLLEVYKPSNEQFCIRQSLSDYCNFKVTTSGNLEITPSGNYIKPKKDLFTDRWANLITNTLIGVDVVGADNLIGQYNTAYGYRSGYNLVNSHGNSSFGYYSLYSLVNNSYNTAIGMNSMRYMVDGDYNVAVGYYAGGDDSTFSNANRNVSIGYQAGRGIENNSSGNVFIGYQVGYNEHGSNKLYIDNSNIAIPLIYGEFDNNLLILNGAVGISTTNTLETKFEIQSSINPQFRIRQSTADFCDIGVDTSGNLEITPVGNIEPKKDFFTDRWGNSAYNTLIGMGVVGNNSLTGRYNTIYGYHAGYDLTSGQYNTLLGCQSGLNITTGVRNITIGRYASQLLTTGDNNIVIGYQTGRRNIDGTNNIFLGYQAAAGTTSYSDSDDNIVLGYRAGYRFTTDMIRNIILGREAGYNCLTSNNIYIGYRASYNNNAGENNISIGFNSGYRSEGSRNIFLGYRAGYNENVDSDRLYIANTDTSNPLIYGEFDNNLLRINGNLEITDDLEHTGDNIGFFNTTPVSQQSTISNPSGGSVIDSEARDKINELIDVLQAYGLLN